MPKKDYSRLLIFLAVIAVVIVACGLLTMKEKRGAIENIDVIHKLAPDTEPGDTGDKIKGGINR